MNINGHPVSFLPCNGNHKAEMSDYRLVDFSQLTEIPGVKATKEQIERIYHRYRFVRDIAENKVILEVACGSGLGLGFLNERARYVVGGDIDRRNLKIAQELYKGTSVDLCKLDAHYLPFSGNRFDLVLLYEAIYYLKFPDLFIEECGRILKKNGLLVICTVNRDWKDFHPSPHAIRYFSIPELYGLLGKVFHDVKFYGAFPVEETGLSERAVSLLKRIAVRLNLIPGTLAGRAYLKRLFLGPLVQIPEQLVENMAPYREPVMISPRERNGKFKIVYAVSRILG